MQYIVTVVIEQIRRNITFMQVIFDWSRIQKIAISRMMNITYTDLPPRPACFFIEHPVDINKKLDKQR